MVDSSANDLNMKNGSAFLGYFLNLPHFPGIAMGTLNPEIQNDVRNFEQANMSQVMGTTWRIDR